MKQFAAITAFFLLSLTGISQTGSITGTITEKTPSGTTEPVIGGIVYIDSTAKGRVGTQTDFDGKYKLTIAPGVYSVTCKYPGYSPKIIRDVKVVAGKSTPLDFFFDPSLNIDTNAVVFIYDTRPTNSVSAVIDTIRKGNSAAIGVGQAQIKKLPATDAGQVARTLPGVTLVDNRFVVVRGLSERYNAVWLNGVNAPSVEADVKAFSFDLIPSSMIDNFMIYQSPAADLPGEFAGGAIRINTTDIPSENSLQIGYAGGYRSGTTFDPFSLNKGTSSDLFAMGKKSRALPSSFPSNLLPLMTTNNTQALQDAGRSMGNKWGYETFNAPIDSRFNATWSHRYSKPGGKGKDGYQFGNITGFNYSNTYSNFMNYRLDYNTYDSINQHSDTVFSYEDHVYRQSVRVAFIQNNALRFGKGGSQRITFKNLYNQMGDNETTIRGGRNIEEGNYRQEYSYRYTQRSIYTGQLGGQHSFNNKRTQFDWTTAYSLSRRSDPDWKKARYTKDLAALPDDKYTIYVPGVANPSPSFLGRIFIDMNEDIISGAANFQQLITLGADSATKKAGFTFTVKTGLYVENKERDFNIRNLGYVGASTAIFGNQTLLQTPIESIFSDENINQVDGFEIAEDTKGSDQYHASNTLQAGYLMAVLPVGNFIGKNDSASHERFRINIGTRIEHNVQKLNSSTIQGDTVDLNNDITRVLPSLNIALNLTDRMLIRASYGKTLNRPEFREIAPLYFYDFIFNSINTGNQNLKTPSIDNYDLRWEFYPRPGENITFGVFYKKFVNPIEVYFIPGVGSGGTRSFTWGNAPVANNYGAEVEFRKKLDQTKVPVIKDLGIVSNAAFIRSVIELDSIGTTRPMMGQSPWIINAGLFYQNDSIGLQINAMYNVIGPRVIIVGVPGVPEVYEMPRHQIDLSIIKTFGAKKNIDVRLNITDLLNQENLLMQDANNDGKLDRATDQRMQYYKRGTYFTFGVNVRLGE